MANNLKNYGIILASGTGSRYNNDIPKQFVKIAGKTVLEHTIEIFERSEYIDNIIIVITPEYRELAQEIILKNNYKKIIKLLNGGLTRKQSSSIGINSINEKEANVIIHDCARPFLSQRILKDCYEALKKYDAVDVAINTADTIIKVDNNFIQEIPERKAHELSVQDENFTDDCGLIIKYNLGKVFVVEGDIENIKITYPSDIFMADRLFQLRSMTCPENIDLTNIKDKIIVIFGGTSGIGKSIKELAEKWGAKVFSTSVSQGCNITSFEDVSSFLKTVHSKTQKIDYIINTAGVLNMGKLEDRLIEDIVNDININYIGSVNVVKASIPYLKETKGCLLLFTSSSYTRGRALYSTYSSSKSAIVNLSQALAEELLDDGVRINAINPERTATPMRFNAFGYEPEGSLLKPETVAQKTIKVLLSDLTGQVIDVRKDG